MSDGNGVEKKRAELRQMVDEVFKMQTEYLDGAFSFMGFSEEEKRDALEFWSLRKAHLLKLADERAAAVAH